MRNLATWFETCTQGPALFQLCLYAILVILMALFFIYYPAGLPAWRFFLAEALLAALLLLNILSARRAPGASPSMQALLDWAFLILSALLITGAIWSSRSLDLVYLVSILCVQAHIKRGIWPSGILFSAVNLGVWLVIMTGLGLPWTEITARETSLAIGMGFGLVVVVLLNRATRQTKIAQDLLQELQTAHHELESAQAKEKELAVAEERLRLARDLHDSVTQSLYGVSLYAEAAADQLRAGDMAKAESHLSALRDSTQTALREMRLMIFELRRPALAQSGLADALRARLAAVETRAGVHTEFTVTGTRQPCPEVQAELHGILQEALNNALKHARAQNVWVRLCFEAQVVEAQVRDDGVGFAPDSASLICGFGLAGMQERARKIGARLQIESAPGQGTRVSVQAPYSLPDSLIEAESEHP